MCQSAAIAASSMTVNSSETPRAAEPQRSSSNSISSVSTSSCRNKEKTDLIQSHDDDVSDGSSSYYYLTPNAVRRLPDYQYSGMDMSYLYKYILSPLAGWLVDHCTPATAAPNAITLFGLMWMVASYSIVWFYCPALHEAYHEGDDDGRAGESVPRWIFFFNGAAMLIYQTLDNMDGKQARKTGSSSPLGLLFDHGCDAVNLILGSANWMAAMGLDPAPERDLVHAFLLVFCPMIAFYFSTWEQYYTGTLLLPVFNGPSEGLCMGAALSFVSFWLGPAFWHGDDGCRALLGMLPCATGADGGVLGLGECLPSSIWSLTEPWLTPRGTFRNMDIIVLAAVLALTQEIVVKAVYVVRVYGTSTLVNLLPNVVLVGGTAAALVLDPELFARCPRTMMHLIAGLFVEQTTQLMLDHMVCESYSPFRRWTLLPLVAMVTFIQPMLSVEGVDGFYLAYTTGLWVYLAFKIQVCVHEICGVLGIWCFDIVTPRGNSKVIGEVSPNKEDIVGTLVGVEGSSPSDASLKKKN